MKTVLLPSPGTTFGRLTVIREARTPNGRQGMLCLCECGRQKIVQVSKLVSGHTKSCDCLRRSVIDLTRLSPGEVPLYGKKAAGRVAWVDNGDFESVMQYRWHVTERARSETRRPVGPYAVTNIYVNGKPTSLLMHCLIMGITGVDHIDHDGLNNRRSNLRPATGTQNLGNQRPHLSSATSPYKGVSWFSPARRWQAGIQVAKRKYHLGYFASEIEAAYAYDAAARELFGEFACPNFPDEPTVGTKQRELEGRLF
jgi:AP2 domain